MNYDLSLMMEKHELNFQPTNTNFFPFNKIVMFKGCFSYVLFSQCNNNAHKFVSSRNALHGASKTECSKVKDNVINKN